MSNVIDLTRQRRNKKLRSLSGSTLTATYATKPLPAFLQEVNLGAMRGCYFTFGFTPTDTLIYDLGWMKIPEGFQFVEYRVNNGVVTFDYKEKNKVTEAILTPLLLPFSSAEVSNESHICTIFHDPNKVVNRMVGNPNGCSQTLAPIRTYETQTTNSAATLMARTVEQIPVPFYLFSYKGSLITGVDEMPSSEDSEYFLIPIILSEKSVAYSAFLKDEKTFLMHYDAAQTKNYAEIMTPLVLNDLLGIFVTSGLDWQ